MSNKKGSKISYAKYGYLFSLPFAIVYLIFHLYPTVYTAILGFTDCKGLGNNNWHIFTEDILRNFRTILNNNTFKTALSNTVLVWIMNFIPQSVLALLLTAWFTSKRNQIKGQGFFKVVFYMPNIITAASVAILFNPMVVYADGPGDDLRVLFGLRSGA